MGHEPRIVGLEGAFGRTNERLGAIERRLDRIDAKFDRIDEKFDRIDEKFDRVDERFERMDAKFDGLHHEMALQFRWIVGITLGGWSTVAAALVAAIVHFGR